MLPPHHELHGHALEHLLQLLTLGAVTNKCQPRTRHLQQRQ
jgi:hypothetical protein